MSDFPRCMGRVALEQRVRLRIVGKSLVLGIEGQFALQAAGQIGGMAKIVPGHRRIYRGNGCFAAFHAIEEIALVAGTLNQPCFEAGGIETGQILRLRVDSVAVHVHPSVRAFEGGAMGIYPAVALHPFITMRERVAGGLAMIAAIGHSHELHGQAGGKLEIDFPHDGGVTDALLGAENPLALDFHLPGCPVTRAP